MKSTLQEFAAATRQSDPKEILLSWPGNSKNDQILIYHLSVKLIFI